MAQYQTFKNIVDDMKKLVENHKMIHSFGIGDIKDFIFLTQQVDGEDNTKNNAPIYPLLYMVPQGTTRDDSQITYNFNVIIADIDNTKNKDITVDLWSDTLEYAEDVLAQFNYGVTVADGDFYEKYEAITPTSIIPFSEQYEDLLVGHTLNLQIIVDKPLNRCIAPYNNWDCE